MVIFGLIIMIMGFSLFLYGLIESLDIRSKKKKYILREGKVTDYYENPKEDGSIYRLVVTYEVDNIPYECVSRFAHQKMKETYPLGSKVLVRYNPDSPEESFLEKDMNGIMLLFIGLIFMVMGFLLIFVC